MKLNSGLPFRADTEGADIITKFFSGYDRAVRPGSGKGIVSTPAACQNNKSKLRTSFILLVLQAEILWGRV